MLISVWISKRLGYLASKTFKMDTLRLRAHKIETAMLEEALLIIIKPTFFQLMAPKIILEEVQVAQVAP